VRRGELLGIEVPDIDLRKNELVIHRTPVAKKAFNHVPVSSQKVFASDTASTENTSRAMTAIVLPLYSRPSFQRVCLMATTALLGVELSACSALPYRPMPIDVPAAWGTMPVQTTKPHMAATQERWWSTLGDPSVNVLIDAALTDNPSLMQAVARIDAARAELGMSAANQKPVVGATAAFNRGRVQAGSGNGAGSGATEMGTSTSIVPNLSWELDVFGRLRSATTAAQNRLDARTADANTVRISVTTRIADEVLAWRTCAFSERRKRDIVFSLAQTERLTASKAAVGMAAQVDVLRAHITTSSAASDASAQASECERSINALVALSGIDKAAVRKSLVQSPAAGLHAEGGASTYGSSAPSCDPSASNDCSQPIILPEPPVVSLSLPAMVLAGHPGVVAADRDAAAAWADIQASKADHWPRIDLVGFLAKQWLNAAGSAINFTTWSLGPSLSGVVFDGGRNAASVDGAEARYRDAVANLQLVLRNSAQDIENALSHLRSTGDALTATRSSEQDNRAQLNATERRVAAGSTAMFELENGRRQLAQAQIDLAFAARDRAQAWVALVRATGNSGLGAPVLTSEKDNLDAI
jgi:multidrug efflux system outer membrane protein